MPPTATRRSHNKTRLGCGQCKKKRIKCDGRHPICANCEKKGQECSFIALAPSSRLSGGSISSSSNAPSPPSPPDIPLASPSSQVAIVPKTPYQVQVFRYARSPSPRPSPKPTTQMVVAAPEPIEVPRWLGIPPSMRLNDIWKDIRAPLAPHLQSVLYHYEYTTSLTLANDDSAKSAWQHFVPVLAAQHQFLVDCVLSIASLHLNRLHEGPAEKEAMRNVAAAQMNKALGRYRRELGNINADNAAALFACTTLTAVYFFRTSTVDIDEIRASVPAGTINPPTAVVDGMMHCVLRTLHGLRGPSAVLITGWDHVVSGSMGPVAQRKWWPKDRLPATDRAREEDSRLAGIASLWRHPGQHGEPHHDTLSAALHFLRETFALVSQLTLPTNAYPPVTSISYSVDDTTVGSLKDRGAMFLWASRISRDFIWLVEQKNRDALVIVAHYAALLGRVRNVWWLEGLGAAMVTAIAMALGRENWSLIEWPVQIVGVDLENAFGKRVDRYESTFGEMCMEVI